VRDFCFEIFYAILFTNLVNLDFFRAAAFFLMIPRFAALSIALYTRGRSFAASFLFFTALSFLTSFKIFRIADRRRSLKTRFRFDARNAFFAPLVIGMSVLFAN